MQKLNMLYSNWPENIHECSDSIKENLTRNIYMNNFLKTYHYKKVWENIAFKILIPDEIRNESGVQK
jgi:hypothetical protein